MPLFLPTPQAFLSSSLFFSFFLRPPSCRCKIILLSGLDDASTFQRSPVGYSGRGMRAAVPDLCDESFVTMYERQGYSFPPRRPGYRGLSPRLSPVTHSHRAPQQGTVGAVSLGPQQEKSLFGGKAGGEHAEGCGGARGWTANSLPALDRKLGPLMLFHLFVKPVLLHLERSLAAAEGHGPVQPLETSFKTL